MSEVLQGRREAGKLPGNPEAGKVLFFGKARCAECHMVAEREDSSDPT